MSNRQAFSLIEMTIILTIIAILTAGVTVAQKLIKTNQLNRVITEVRLYHADMDIFRLKFNAHAGDYSEAGLIWGNDCNGLTSGSDLCSGDGNDILAEAATNEMVNAWAHIYKAQINNNFYPFSSTVNWQDNVPASALENGSLYLFASGQKGLILELRSRDDEYGAISHLDAYQIDNKIDDGILAKGNIYGACGAGIVTYDLDFGNFLVCGLKFK